MAVYLTHVCLRRCREQMPEYADCDIEDELGAESLRLKRVLLGYCAHHRERRKKKKKGI